MSSFSAEYNRAVYNPRVGEADKATISGSVNRELFTGSSVSLVFFFLEGEWKPPQEGDFLDIGAGFGNFVVGMADTLQNKYPNANFVGVDIGNMQPELISEGLKKRVKFIEYTDGFLHLVALPDNSLSMVTMNNISEVIGAMGSEDRVHEPNNLSFLGVQLLRVLTEGGIAFISTGLYQPEVELLCQAESDEFELTALPIDFAKENCSYYFQKVKKQSLPLYL